MAQYLKPDCELGYVEDTAQIENLKFNNLRHSVLGCMLGDFNEVGNYVVSPEIVKELIAMEKYIVQTYDNIELCKSNLKIDKQISFMVTFEGNRAILSLVEKMNYEGNFKINSGTYSNINEYVLDVVETNGDINRNVVYARWNISPFGGNVVDIFNCDDSVLEKYFGIVNRFKYLLKANKLLLIKEEEMEEIESSYSNEIFTILKHHPKLQKAVIETVKQTLTEKKDAINPKKPFFTKTFNEVLEHAIEKNKDVLGSEETQEFEKEKHNAVMNLNIKRDAVFEISHEKDENVQGDKVSPAVLRFKPLEENQNKSVNEVAEEFVASFKTEVQRIAMNNVDKKSEKGKLFAVLAAAEIEGFIDKTENENKTQIATVAPTTSKPEQNAVKKVENKPVANNVGRSTTGNKSGGGQSTAKKVTGQRPAQQPTNNTAGEKPKKETGKPTTETLTIGRAMPLNDALTTENKVMVGGQAVEMSILEVAMQARQNAERMMAEGVNKHATTVVGTAKTLETQTKNIESKKVSATAERIIAESVESL